MKNENKCFFSISLENGITITGENPIATIDFLYDLHHAFYKLGEQYKRKGYEELKQDAWQMMDIIENAINTIDENLKNRRTE